MPVSEEPAEASPEEPLGLDLIRAWLAKPRPRLYRLWLWVPLTAKGIRRAFRWLRTNGVPAMRRAADKARQAAKLIHVFRKTASRLAARLRTAFPPGSRGHQTALHLAAASRGLGHAGLALFGLGGDLDRISSVLKDEDEPSEPSPEPDRQPILTKPPPAPESRAAPEPDAPSRGRMLPRGPSASSTSPSGKEPPVSGAPRPAATDSQPASAAPTGPRTEALAELPHSLRVQILTLGRRPRKAALRLALWRIVGQTGPATSEDLGLLLDMDSANLAKRHLSPLVEDGILERTIPDRINHPDQAYRATGRPPG